MTETSVRDVGLLALRLGVGGTLAVHGAQKLFGSFGGGGIEGTAGFFESAGFTPGKVNAVAAGLGEFGGGLGLALGLATPAAGGAAAGTMVVAGSLHAPNGFFNTGGGYELPAILGLASAAIALTGPGRLSVDAVLGHALNKHWMRAAALGAVLPAAGVVIARRRRAQAAAAAAAPADTSESEPVAAE